MGYRKTLYYGFGLAI